MRILPVLSVTIAALGLTACTYVERERPPPPAPVVVQPTPQTMAPPPTVTVRPSY